MAGPREQPCFFPVAEYLRLQRHFEERDRELLAGLLSLKRRQPALLDKPGTGEGPAGDIGGGRQDHDSGPMPGAGDYPARLPALPFARHLGSRARPGFDTSEPEPAPTRLGPQATARQPIPSILLQPWQALWPFIRQLLSGVNPSRQVDMPRLIDDLCAARPLRQIPFAQVQAWPQKLVVIVDASPHLAPVYEDFLHIIGRLSQWFPKRLVLWLLEDAEQAEFKELRGPHIDSHNTLPAIPEHGAVLVLSDLGMAHPQPWSRCNWRQWGRKFRRHRHRPLALVPAHPADWDHVTTRDFQCAFLEREHRLQRQQPAPGSRDAAAELEALKTLLAPMGRITPALLRQARILHPHGLSVSAEIDFWSLPGFGTALNFREWQDDGEQRSFLERLAHSPSLSRLAEQLMQEHEKSLPMRLQIQQKQAFAAIRMVPLNDEQKRYLAHLHQTMHTLPPLERRFFANWMSRLEDRKGEAAWLADIEPLYRLYYEQLSPEQQRTREPPGHGKGPSWWIEVIETSEGVTVKPGVPFERSTGPEGPGCRHIVTIPALGSVMVRCYQGRRRVRQQVLKPGEDFAFSGHLTRLTIDTGQKVETVDWPTCPSWARGIGRDRYGLFVEVTVQGVEFVMRWIPPGEFMMGSPGDEPERFNDEGPQHLVQFTHGFWLAETACTQALWQAVMGENPSEFKGDELPVENVSWTDAQKFIEQANRIHPGLALRLPSEAEWEYGCRAGTSMPFWFGTELITDRANYDGRSPYADGKKGERRGKTVEVKRFQPNPWGLYQVHGNVWEWCADPWHDNYEGAPDDGRAWEKDGDSERAVLRGGSWFNLGRRLRSAFRGRDHRDFAGIIGDFGFRLARGPESPGAAGGRGRRGSQAERGTSAASATTGPARAGNEQLRGA